MTPRRSGLGSPSYGVVELFDSWHPDNFLERLDQWIEQESPSGYLATVVTSWVFSRMEQPYQGARREPGFPNLWTCVVPGSLHSDERIVLCSFWIFESEQVVRCDSFATLTLPI